MTPTFSLCVYCGSRSGASAEYTRTAQAVGAWIGQHDGQLVYGGGRAGLMGEVAQATQQAGGRVVGVIPRALEQRECAWQGCTELHIVESMHERKHMMAERADAFLVLPGGIGTFEEFFEVWTWRQLGYHDKPIGLLNLNGYYDGLLAFLDSTVQQEFLSTDQLDLIAASTNVDELLPRLIQSAGLTTAPRLEQI